MKVDRRAFLIGFLMVGKEIHSAASDFGGIDVSGEHFYCSLSGKILIILGKKKKSSIELKLMWEMLYQTGNN